MDQDATWYRGRPRPRRHYVIWGPSSPYGNGHSSPHFLAHVNCGQTVTHLSNCWALVKILPPLSLSSKFFVKSPLKILSHFNCIVTLPWVILGAFLTNSNQRPNFRHNHLHVYSKSVHCESIWYPHTQITNTTATTNNISVSEINTIPVVISDEAATDGVLVITGCCICCKYSAPPHRFDIVTWHNRKWHNQQINTQQRTLHSKRHNQYTIFSFSLTGFLSAVTLG